MAGTSLGPVKRAMIDFVSNLDTFGGVQVSYGLPRSIEREAFWLEGANGEVTIPTLRAGRKRREESYELRAILSVMSTHDTQETADIRAAELLTAIDEALADDPLLGLTSADVLHVTLEGWEHLTGPTESGYGSGFKINFRVVARAL